MISLLLAIKIIAHMGASQEAPENTLPAFEKAIELNADCIEFDVRLTQDGIPVVIHDASVGWDFETPHSYPIKNLTLEELLSFDLGSWYGPQFSGEQVPTLESVLDLNFPLFRRKKLRCRMHGPPSCSLLEREGRTHSGDCPISTSFITPECHLFRCIG